MPLLTNSLPPPSVNWSDPASSKRNPLIRNARSVLSISIENRNSPSWAKSVISAPSGIFVGTSNSPLTTSYEMILAPTAAYAMPSTTSTAFTVPFAVRMTDGIRGSEKSTKWSPPSPAATAVVDEAASTAMSIAVPAKFSCPSTTGWSNRDASTNATPASLVATTASSGPDGSAEVVSSNAVADPSRSTFPTIPVGNARPFNGSVPCKISVRSPTPSRSVSALRRSVPTISSASSDNVSPSVSPDIANVRKAGGTTKFAPFPGVVKTVLPVNPDSGSK